MAPTSLPVRPVRTPHPGHLKGALSLPGPRVVALGAELLEHGGAFVPTGLARPAPQRNHGLALDSVMVQLPPSLANCTYTIGRSALSALLSTVQRSP